MKAEATGPGGSFDPATPSVERCVTVLDKHSLLSRNNTCVTGGIVGGDGPVSPVGGEEGRTGRGGEECHRRRGSTYRP